MLGIYVALQALQLLWLVGLTAFAYLRKPGLDATAAAKQIEAEFAEQLRLHRHETERQFREQLLMINSIEAHMEHMPSKEDVAELEGSVKSIAERINGLADTLSALKGATTRIEDFLLRSRG